MWQHTTQDEDRGCEIAGEGIGLIVAYKKMWCDLNESNWLGFTLSFDFMSLRIKQSSYGYNPSYDSQVWSSSEVQNLDCFFDMLIYPSRLLIMLDKLTISNL